MLITLLIGLLFSAIFILFICEIATLIVYGFWHIKSSNKMKNDVKNFLERSYINSLDNSIMMNGGSSGEVDFITTFSFWDFFAKYYISKKNNKNYVISYLNPLHKLIKAKFKELEGEE